MAFVTLMLMYSLGLALRLCPWVRPLEYCMGTNFRGWLNFAVFESTSQTAKNNPGEVLWGYARARTIAIAGHDKLENASPLLLSSNHWPLKRNSVCCFPLPSLVHWSTSTIAQLIQKGYGNYTHNKSMKTKMFENLIITMFQQKHEILTPWNFVPIRYINTRSTNAMYWCNHATTITYHWESITLSSRVENTINRCTRTI